MDKVARSQLAVGLALPALALLAYLSYRRYNGVMNESEVKTSAERAQVMNPPILNDNSTSRFKSYTTKYATYPAIRTFYRPHPHEDALPPLPLFVFIHGLGGCMAQFSPILGSLINIAPCLGIDLPGCGMSAFLPKSMVAYSTKSLAALLKVVIDEHQGKSKRGVIFIGHSMGCSLAALLSSGSAPKECKINSEVLGLVAICPKASPPTQKESRKFRRLLSLPDFVLDTLRWVDRRGGTQSASVKRFVSDDSGIDLKKLQQRYNELFPTAVWKRMTLGCLPQYDERGQAHGGFPGSEIWSGLDVPLLIVAGESDKVTKPEEVSKIVSFMKSSSREPIQQSPESLAVPDSTGLAAIATESKRNSLAGNTSFGSQPSTTETKSHHLAVIRTAILPPPASHSLLYDHEHYRTVAGLIEDFLSKHVSEYLGLGWQLQHLTTSGKWDVKNLEKWKKVEPVSEPIGGGIFRALKTLREQDEEHTPAVFIERWKGKIYAIIDISHDCPIYDTNALQRGGVQYHKFPTVSKIPPTPSEVVDFIALVERLRKEIRERRKDQSNDSVPAIAVHCHYGYNRTGFFIVCYLIEKEGYSVQDAIDDFAKNRPPGIKHDHFIDKLFVRYCVGLKKTPSMN